MNRSAARAIAASMLAEPAAGVSEARKDDFHSAASACVRGRGRGRGDIDRSGGRGGFRGGAQSKGPASTYGFAGGRGGGRGGCEIGRPSESANSPALITSKIKKAGTLEELFQTYLIYEKHLNHIHLAACWNSLKHLARAANPSLSQTHAKALESLVELTTQTVSTGSEIRARELASIAHGVAKCGKANSMGSLLKALARTIEKRLGDCNAQELANIAWAFAKAGHLDAGLFAALARVAEQHLANFKPQELANTAWAFATAGHSDAELFQSLARVVEQRLGDFIMQGLANTLWAFAKAGHLDAQLYRAMANMVQERLNDCNAQDLASIAWAFAKAGQFDGKLFGALARSAERNLDRFTAQGLANIVWAFAKAGHLDAELFASLARSIQRRLDNFNAQDLANTAWAFAKACQLNAQLFTALAKSVERCLDDFNAQDLVNTAWAFAKVGQFEGKLFACIARCVRRRRVGELTAPQIANIAWAFAKADHVDATLFAALAKSAGERVSDLTAKDLANLVWAFANAGHLDAGLFAALAKAAEGSVDEFDEEDLDNTEWAFTKAGQQRIVKRLRQRKKCAAGAGAALAGATVDVSECGRIVVAGGGIGGAAVAVALQSKGFDVVVLEADASFDSRKQGYGLTIQRQDAIQAMGINLAQDDAPSTSHYTFSADGNILGFFGEAFGSKSKDRQESEEAGRFIHIPRQMLRQRIVEQIRPGTILWGSKLKSFSCWNSDDNTKQATTKKKKKGRDDKNGVTVTLMDGRELEASLLVGSDGIFSTVRRQLDLPGDRLNYVGLVVVLGICQEVPLTQRRIFETVDGTTRIYAMPFTTSAAMWQLSFPCAEEQARIFSKDAAALKAEILQRCAGWHEPIPDLLASTPLDCMSGYPVYDRQVLEPQVLRAPQAAASAPHKAQRRVTLIGDAAHPMTPFKAQGANQALSDAVLLADCLVDSIRKHGPHAGLDLALPLFERKMLSRSNRMVIGSREKAKELHSSLALQPARKVQREADGGLDMQEAIRVLRSKGVGAHSASDPRGLDAVVARAIQALRSPAELPSERQQGGLAEFCGSRKTLDDDSDSEDGSADSKGGKEAGACSKAAKKAKKLERQKRRKAEKRQAKIGTSEAGNGGARTGSTMQKQVDVFTSSWGAATGRHDEDGEARVWKKKKKAKMDGLVCGRVHENEKEGNRDAAAEEAEERAEQGDAKTKKKKKKKRPRTLEEENNSAVGGAALASEHRDDAEETGAGEKSKKRARKLAARALAPHAIA